MLSVWELQAKVLLKQAPFNPNSGYFLASSCPISEENKPLTYMGEQDNLLPRSQQSEIFLTSRP